MNILDGIITYFNESAKLAQVKSERSQRKYNEKDEEFYAGQQVAYREAADYLNAHRAEIEPRALRFAQSGEHPDCYHLLQADGDKGD